MTDQEIITQYRRTEAKEREDRYRAWDNLPSCPTCGGSGREWDECNGHVAQVPCGGGCGGTGKRGQGR